MADHDADDCRPAASRVDAEQALIKLLRITVQVADPNAWPFPSSRFSATATLVTDHETFYGIGCGPSAELARRSAVMECVERYAQFGNTNPTPVTMGSYAELEGAAIRPTNCGLYSPAQYATPSFDCAPFDPNVPLEWRAVRHLGSKEQRLLPLEFSYPRARLQRLRLVAETSSGTAAHYDQTSATLAALCELIERDSLMLFWYRQPETLSISVGAIPSPAMRDELQTIQRMGFVVAVCRLVYDLNLPCFLILALRGNTFAYGLGCRPDGQAALSHALAECSQSLRWLIQTSPPKTIYHSLPDVLTSVDHYGLYNRGPFHSVLRQTLIQVLRPIERIVWPGDDSGPEDGAEQQLANVLDALAIRGYHVYMDDLTPPTLADLGVCVVRAVIPGLIPIHFGYHHIRLSCPRLCGQDAPGRLRTLLPHFIS